MVEIAHGHAADHRLVGGNDEVFADDVREAGEGGLGAGVQALGARRDHDALQEHAVIEPAADLQDLVDGADHGHGRIEETVVPRVLGVGLLALALGDTESAIERPADGAPPRLVGLGKWLVRVIGHFLVGEAAIVVGGEQVAFEVGAGLAADHGHFPGLHVDAGRRARGKGEDFLDRLTGHGLRQEGTGGKAAVQCRLDGGGDIVVLNRIHGGLSVSGEALHTLSRRADQLGYEIATPRAACRICSVPGSLPKSSTPSWASMKTQRTTPSLSIMKRLSSGDGTVVCAFSSSGVSL